MKIEVSEDGHIILKEVFSGLEFEAESGEKLLVAMRDNAFEIAVLDKESKPFPYVKNKELFKWYSASSSGIVALSDIPMMEKRTSKETGECDNKNG